MYDKYIFSVRDLPPKGRLITCRELLMQVCLRIEHLVEKRKVSITVCGRVASTDKHQSANRQHSRESGKGSPDKVELKNVWLMSIQQLPGGIFIPTLELRT